MNADIKKIRSTLRELDERVAQAQPHDAEELQDVLGDLIIVVDQLAVQVGQLQQP